MESQKRSSTAKGIQITTIAANLKCMASDSKVDVGGGLSYPADKIKKVKKMLVGAGGDGA